MPFKKLNKKIQDALNKIGFDKPTLPQEMGIPKILEGKNILLIAPTGLGKTESVMLPIFEMWLENKPKPISILYLTPLKSLNRDLLKRFVFWSNELGIDISVRHGDTSAYERKKQVEFPDDMLVSTPETLQAILPAKKMKENLKNIKWVIVDEVHELADSKRGVQLTIALERLRQLCGDFQLIALSATVGQPEEIAKFISGGRQIEIVKATTAKEMQIEVISPKVIANDKELAEQIFSNVHAAARIRKIKDLIDLHESTLIFTNTRDFAEILTSRLKTAYPNIAVDNHHSSLSKSVRIRVEEEFKKQKLKAIVATSSLELGIDIGAIDFIIHYMSPRQPSRAIQRIGRSGHEFKRKSDGVIIATDIDDVFEATVIARQALTEKLQKTKMHENALDVLAHQIIGLLRDNYRIDIDNAYELIKKAYPYRHLTKEQFLSVCLQMAQLKYLFIDQNSMKISRKGLLYYFENLSTIPDTKSYTVINMLTNEKVGTLDEEFVAINATEGSTFIIKGESWNIVSIDGRQIFVEPSSDIEASVPGWEGELMPVPFEVAQEVGQLRDSIFKMIDAGYTRDKVIEEIKKKYPVDDNTARRMANFIKRQIKYKIPTNKKIIIELKDNTAVIHACFGNQVNETLGRFLSSLLSSRIGSVGLKIDPYRIILQMQSDATEILKELIFKTQPDTMESLIDISLPKTKLFEWKFLHVAKRFGIIRSDAELGKVMMSRIIDLYSGTPVWKETIREIKTEKLDIENARKILEMIQKKEIEIVFSKGLSPLAKIGLRMKTELIGPEKPDIQILDVFEKRLMSKKVKLVCMNCGNWTMTMPVKDLPDELRCQKCKAKLIAAVHPSRIEVDNIIKKKLKGSDLTGEELAKWNRMNKISDLIIVYGKKAVIALAARGVGPKTAVRILRGMYNDEKEFFKTLLEAERQFIRTKKFWK